MLKIYLRGHKGFRFQKNVFFSEYVIFYKCSLEAVFKTLNTYKCYCDSCRTVYELETISANTKT